MELETIRWRKITEEGVNRDICKVELKMTALKLVPPGKRRPERLKGTGGRGVETKLKKKS